MGPRISFVPGYAEAAREQETAANWYEANQRKSAHKDVVRVAANTPAGALVLGLEIHIAVSSDLVLHHDAHLFGGRTSADNLRAPDFLVFDVENDAAGLLHVDERVNGEVAVNLPLCAIFAILASGNARDRGMHFPHAPGHKPLAFNLLALVKLQLNGRCGGGLDVMVYVVVEELPCTIERVDGAR